MSVPSRGRYVPHSAPLTARNLRSPQDRNRLRPLARPTPPDLPRRSMSASTIRPVRHSIPLSLSIVGRPHQAGPIRSWRADSLVFVWLDPGITPCCKSRKSDIPKILAIVDLWTSLLLRRLSTPLRGVHDPILDEAIWSLHVNASTGVRIFRTRLDLPIMFL